MNISLFEIGIAKFTNDRYDVLVKNSRSRYMIIKFGNMFIVEYEEPKNQIGYYDTVQDAILGVMKYILEREILV